MSRNIDRRGFLKGAAFMGAGAAAASIMGCSPSTSEDATAEPAESTEAAASDKVTNAGLELNITNNAEADVVVVGAGAAGCSAAVRAAQLGLNVALIEITDRVGGTTIFTEGMTTIHSHYHDEEPEVDIPTEELVKAIQDYHHWLSNGHMIRQMLVQSATNLLWLESIGHEFTGLDTMIPSKTYHTWTRYAHDEGTMSGDGYVKHWGELVTETFSDKITMYFGNEALQTTLGADGAVASVIIKDTGTEEATEIACKAVVYACGGYADNAPLFKELVGFGEGEYISNGAGYRTGDGLVMARDCGAAFCRYPSATMWFGGCLPGLMYGTELYCATAFQPLLWVNENAERFIDEEYSEHNFSFSGNGHSSQKKVFSLLTKAQMDSFVTDGCICGCGAYLLAGTKLDGSATGLAMWDEYQQQVDNGNEYIHTADTLEELAEMCGLDPEKLKNTVETYNGYCDAGEDGDFAKPAEYLLPLKEEDGPYYAFQLVPGVFTTVGGISINDCCQALNEAGEPIVGMYAAGCDAGGLEGDSYDVGICEGSKQCWCAYSGKLAAEHIASTMFGAAVDDEYANPVTWE